MIKDDEFPGIVTDSDLDTSVDPTEPSQLYQVHERQLERAYQLGLLHGINAQSMAGVKADVMEFDDYGWEIDNS